MTAWKKPILIFTSIAVLSGGIFGYLLMDFNREMVSPSAWQSYSPENKRFDIQFPKDPEESHQELVVANKKIQYHQFSTEVKDTFFAVSYLDFPGHWKLLGTNKLLNTSFDMLLENEPNVEELISKELTSHKGHPALLYKMKQNGKEIYGKFVVSGNTLYRVAITTPLSTEMDREAFLESFSIKS